MTLGRQLRRPDLSTTGARWCEAALPERSVYRFLARERIRLFPPELFADLFESTGRRSVPPMRRWLNQLNGRWLNVTLPVNRSMSWKMSKPA